MNISLPETNSSPLKIDGWNTTLLLGWPMLRGELLGSGSVSFFLNFNTYLAKHLDLCFASEKVLQKSPPLPSHNSPAIFLVTNVTWK